MLDLHIFKSKEYSYDKKMMNKTEEVQYDLEYMHQGQNELKNKINKHEEPNHLQK